MESTKLTKKKTTKTNTKTTKPVKKEKTRIFQMPRKGQSKKSAAHRKDVQQIF